MPIIQTDGQHSSCRLTTFDPYEDCNYIDEEIFSPQDFSSVNGLIGVLETGSFNFLADVTNDGGIISDTNKVLGKLQPYNSKYVGKNLISIDPSGKMKIAVNGTPTLCCADKPHPLYNVKHLIAECLYELEELEDLFSSQANLLTKLPEKNEEDTSEIPIIEVRMDSCMETLAVIDTTLSTDLSFVTEAERTLLKNMRDASRNCQDELKLKKIHFIGGTRTKFHLPITFTGRMKDNVYIANGEIYKSDETYDVVQAQYLTLDPPTIGIVLKDWTGYFEIPTPSDTICAIKNDVDWFCSSLKKILENSRCNLLVVDRPINSTKIGEIYKLKKKGKHSCKLADSKPLPIVGWLPDGKLRVANKGDEEHRISVSCGHHFEEPNIVIPERTTFIAKMTNCKLALFDILKLHNQDELLDFISSDDFQFHYTSFIGMLLGIIASGMLSIAAIIYACGMKRIINLARETDRNQIPLVVGDNSVRFRDQSRNLLGHRHRQHSRRGCSIFCIRCYS